MRSANLFLLLGTIGFLNIYEDLMGEDETGKLDQSEAKQLQRKFGVKEKRSAERSGAPNPQQELRHHFEDYSEELVEYLKRPVFRGLRDCNKAREEACDCLKLICFGQADCTRNLTPIGGQGQPASGGSNNGADGNSVKLRANDPRYIYYVTGRRLRARHGSDALWPGRTREASTEADTKKRQQFLKCRQTTINPYVLCECKKYTRLAGP